MRRVPAILIVIFLAVPLFFTAFLSISVGTWALDRGFYTALLSDERLYQIPDVSALWWSDAVPEMQGVDSRAVVLASREVLTPSYLREQAVSVVNQAFDFLQGRGDAFDLSVDLRPVKTALLGEPGRRFARELAKDLPVGGASGDFVVKARTIPRARPSSMSVEKAAAVIQAGLPALASSIPDTVRLSDSPSFHFTPYGWGMGFNLLGALIFAAVVLLVFACGFWLAAAFTGGATRYERLQWLGWSLFVPAVGVFLIGLLTILGLFSSWATWGIGQAHLETEGFAPSFAAALVEAARHALARVDTGFIATGAVAGGVSLGLLAWSWSIPASERAPASAQVSTPADVTKGTGA